mmetsp:Transcript_14359/g.35987  ORF Transcript_14359/g.35987 Transcript_14359/m.35987 type:complete len:258 (+) Transcript_14359:348-1121(+)
MVNVHHPEFRITWAHLEATLVPARVVLSHLGGASDMVIPLVEVISLEYGVALVGDLNRARHPEGLAHVHLVRISRRVVRPLEFPRMRTLERSQVCCVPLGAFSVSIHLLLCQLVCLAANARRIPLLFAHNLAEPRLGQDRTRSGMLAVDDALQGRGVVHHVRVLDRECAESNLGSNASLLLPSSEVLAQTVHVSLPGRALLRKHHRAIARIRMHRSHATCTIDALLVLLKQLADSITLHSRIFVRRELLGNDLDHGK